MTLQDIYDSSRRIVFFGGAGVSTESGIKDFRSQDGLYHMAYEYPPEEILSHTFFMRQPEVFFRFYRDKILTDHTGPNAAHKALAEMEKLGKLSAVITQNIDGLHQAAGSQNVLELHGTVMRNHCMRCGKLYGVEAIKNSDGIPSCSCGGRIKPDVILYEEALEDTVVERAVDEIRRADTLIVGGTSLAVYPAAGLLRYFRGSHLVLINRDETPADKDADLVIHDSIGKVLGALKLS